MYLGVDIGGTKTLIAKFDDNGQLLDKEKFPTPQQYSEFKGLVTSCLSDMKISDLKAAAVAVPAVRIDRSAGIAMSYANLSWRNNNIPKDLEEILHCPVEMENDAKLAGLSEADLIKDHYSKVMYLTVSTGIGYSLIVNGKIDVSAGDSGGRLILLPKDGQLKPWESFASGKSIVEKYGKMAKDIEDEATWDSITKDIAEGLIELIAIFQPQIVVIGGSVGEYFSRYGHLLKKHIDDYNLPFITMPEIRGAINPNEAVVYGCFLLASGHGRA